MSLVAEYAAKKKARFKHMCTWNELSPKFLVFIPMSPLGKTVYETTYRLDTQLFYWTAHYSSGEKDKSKVLQSRTFKFASSLE